MKIKSVKIVKFRGFKDQEFELGSQLTAIAGQNGTQKSTLLGMITQTFTISKDNPMVGEKPLCGGSYRSAFSDKFRLSPTFDKPKEHEWSLLFDDGVQFEIESIKRSHDSNIRFWKKRDRKKGDGYIQFPTIFLSLKRLMPLAEEDNIETDKELLNSDEIKKFIELHNKILISNIEITSTTGISSRNNKSVGVSTALFDWNQNSVGQDNLSKILLSLFSFQRLKDNYQSYQGGILAIDELDATMYPASQVELLNVLRKYASDLNLQIIFTTHSLSLLDAVNELRKKTNNPETSDQIRLVYLKRCDDNIIIRNDIDIQSIKLDLTVSAQFPKQSYSKTTVYVEDKETELFVKAILKKKAKVLLFVKATFSCGALIELVSKKVPAFCYPNSLIFLDGDVRKRKGLEKIINAKNVLLLPGNESPERMLAKFLNKISDADPLWTSLSLGYSKQVCFRDFSFSQIVAQGEAGRQDAKKWFNSQKPYWGRSATKVMNRFLEEIDQDVKKFLADYDRKIALF